MLIKINVAPVALYVSTEQRTQKQMCQSVAIVITRHIYMKIHILLDKYWD